ncbi:MAG: sugar ABC transporter ATP-binding protein [Burkholderiales bacterium]|nr:sugar ABC transporter ATP-binding protein [Anaerolineae bacterium]
MQQPVNAVTSPAQTDSAAESSDSILQMRAITKAFPGVTALSDVSFDLRRGEIHCLMGENGAGKSTLMKILSGIYTEYEGEMLLDGKAVRLQSVRDAWNHGISMIHQELNLVPELTVYENIYLGRELQGLFGVRRNRDMIDESRRLLQELGADIDSQTPIRRLRVGERQLVEIAKALGLRSHILIMDEPTSALSAAEVDHLFSVMRKLRESGVSIIYISHRMDEVFALADRITVLRDGRHIVTAPASELTRTQLIHHMVGRDLGDMQRRSSSGSGEPLLKVRHLSLNRPGVIPLKDISFDVHKGEVLGIAGLMGAGRTELLETLFGVHPSKYVVNEIVFKDRVGGFRSPAEAIKHGLGYVTEDRKAKSLLLGFSVRFNATLASLHSFAGLLSVVNRRAENEAVRRTVEQLDIRTPSIETRVANLSGGNQQKVVLAKFLLAKPDLLLLDEPTRGIDVGAKAQIYELVSQLVERGTTCIVVSSEMPELLAVCDRILVLCEGRLTGEFSRAEATQEAILEAAMRFESPVN